MNKENFNIIFGFILGVIISYFVLKIIFLKKINEIKKKSVKKSREVILGQINEQLAPLLPNFPWNFKDAVFIGKGIDYIIFDGLSEKNLKQIIFLEIKSGKSRQNLNEKSIQKCIENKNVKYKIWKIE